MNVESKEFWEKVKNEYNPNETCYGICYSSPTFERMWNDISTYPRKDILVISYAESFVKENNLNLKCGCTYLFSFMSRTGSVLTYHEIVQTRKQFIDYMINKFS